VPTLRVVGAGELAEVFDDLDELACRWPCGGAGDRVAAVAAELEQALVAEQAAGGEDGVGVDAEDGGEVLGGGSRPPGFASPSAIARRISAATCS
jgi:hypothetical protein